jgi:hypothetical protein
VKLGDHQNLLHSFQIHKISNEFGNANLVVLAFDLSQTGKSFDLLVKDLDQDMLAPVLILSTDG